VSKAKWDWGLVFLVVLAGGCASPVPVTIHEHRFVVSDLRETTAAQLEAELQKEGINVRRVDSQPKGSIIGIEIADYTFVISDPNYTERDLAKVTKRITNPERKEPIVIRSTTVEQEYASVWGEGTARVVLRIEITEGARVFFKETGEEVPLQRIPGKKAATFEYERKRKEEYVDIYIVPGDADPHFKPKTFLRISLSYPYETKQLPWDQWYVRLWKALFGETK